MTFDNTAIRLFIPSKDRACQLDALLQSLEDHCPGLFMPYIIWKASNESYFAGYCKVLKKFEDVIAFHEKNIHDDFMTFLKVCHCGRYSDVFCMATDDCIFYRPCSIEPEDVNFAMDDETFCFSFRLGLNTIVQDYSTGRLQPPLSYYDETYSKYIKWHWKSHNPTDNYGYCAGQDFCCYRATDLLQLLDFPFNNLRHVESVLSTEKRIHIMKEWMASPRESCAVNIPCNNMQEPFISNPALYQVSPEDLNRRYLDGETIILSDVYNAKIVGCHQNIPIRTGKNND